MQIQHVALMLTFIVTCVAGADDFSDAKSAVLEVLVDPESAKFGDFVTDKKGKIGCMTINSKNRYGGYAGTQQMILHKQSGKWVPITSVESSQADCLTLANKVLGR